MEKKTSPIGTVNLAELDDLEIAEVAGAQGTGHYGTWGCCWCLPWYSGFTKCGLACDAGKVLCR